MRRKGAVVQGRLAGLLDLLSPMPAGHRKELLQRTHSLDDPGLGHDRGPSVRAFPERRVTPQECAGAAPKGRDLLGGGVVRGRAEATGLPPHVRSDLLHPAVVDPHQAPVPAHLDPAIDAFWRRRAVGLLHRNVGVAVYRALGLMVERRGRRQRGWEHRLLPLQRRLAHLPARRAMDTVVGHLDLPAGQMAVPLRDPGESSPLQGIVTAVAYPALHLALVARRGRGTRDVGSSGSLEPDDAPLCRPSAASPPCYAPGRTVAGAHLTAASRATWQVHCARARPHWDRMPKQVNEACTVPPEASRKCSSSLALNGPCAPAGSSVTSIWGGIAGPF